MVIMGYVNLVQPAKDGAALQPVLTILTVPSEEVVYATHEI